MTDEEKNVFECAAYLNDYCAKQECSVCVFGLDDGFGCLIKELPVTKELIKRVRSKDFERS